MKCPCKECISYAICNSIIRNKEIPDVSQHSLNRNCDDLQHFLGMGLGDRKLCKRDINNARKVFGLKELAL
jgi:hypothetical protein